MRSEPAVVVTVPAEEASVHLLRTVVAAVGARRSCSLDEIDDLRLAVTESASEVLRVGTGPELSMAVATSPRAIEVVVGIDGPPGEPKETSGLGAGRGVREQILSALVHEATSEKDGRGVRIRLVKWIEGGAT